MTSKLASLHSGLVARKGEAMPAVSHPLFSYVDTPRPVPREDRFAERRIWPPVPEQEAPVDAGSEQIESIEPEVIASVDARATQPEQVAKTVEQPVLPSASAPAHKSAAPKVEASNGDSDALRHRMTLRLSHEQHHRLRLAAAIRDQSLQYLLSEALDNHLDGLCACSLKDCACMAAAAEHQKT